MVRIHSGIPVSKDLAALETAASSDKTSLTGSKTEARNKAKLRRLDVANRILRTIHIHGPLVFSDHADSACQGKSNRYAEFFWGSTGRLKYRDRWSGIAIDVCSRGRWRFFWDGETMRGVVKNLRDFIISGKEGVVFVDKSWGYKQSERKVCNAALLRIYAAEGMYPQPPKSSRRWASASIK